MNAPQSLARRMGRRFLQHRLAVASLLTLLLLALLSLGAPLLEDLLGLDGQTINLFQRNQPPSLEHPLGTDEIGRDLLARLLQGGRVSLAVAVVAALASAVIGTMIGVIAGYYGGRFAALLMRFTDGVISLPLLPHCSLRLLHLSLRSAAPSRARLARCQLSDVLHRHVLPSRGLLSRRSSRVPRLPRRV